jgi:hypothetical protein
MTSLMTRNVKLIPAAVFLFDRIALYFLMVTHFTLLFLQKETILCHCPHQFVTTGAQTAFKISDCFLTDTSVITAADFTSSGATDVSLITGHTTTCTVNPREHKAPLFCSLPRLYLVKLLTRLDPSVRWSLNFLSTSKRSEFFLHLTF